MPLSKQTENGDDGYRTRATRANFLCRHQLRHARVTDVDEPYVKVLLGFNYAVWKFRKPAQASRLTQTPEWMLNRIIECAQLAP